MLKVMAVLRTMFLIFAVGYTVRALPFFTSLSRTFDDQYARCTSAVDLLVRAAWFCIGWIVFDTAVGWWLATRGGKKAVSPAAPLPAPGAGAVKPPYESR